MCVEPLKAYFSIVFNLHPRLFLMLLTLSIKGIIFGLGIFHIISCKFVQELDVALFYEEKRQ